MSTNIKVAIKVRPLIKREKDDSLPIQWIVQENSIVSTDPETRRRGDGGFRFGMYSRAVREPENVRNPSSGKKFPHISNVFIIDKIFRNIYV